MSNPLSPDELKLARSSAPGEFEMDISAPSSNLDIAANDEVYNLLSGIDNPNGWEEGHQEDNFDRLVGFWETAGVSIQGASCIDVGCGTGEFSEYWRKMGGGQYYGIDIYSPSIENARVAHTSDRFEERDLLTDKPREGEEYDFAFCSGAFSVKQRSRDNYEFLQQMLTQIIQMSKQGVAFNFLTDESPDPIDLLHYYSPEKVVELCQEIAPAFDVHMQHDKDRHQAEVFLLRRVNEG